MPLRLISYGVDARRARRLIQRDPLAFHEDVIEDEADWRRRLDRLHHERIARGAPPSAEALRQVLLLDPFDPHPLGAPLYLACAELLCDYFGQRLDTRPYHKGFPWDEESAELADLWLRARNAPSWLDQRALTGGEQCVWPQLAGMGLQTGWIDEERCDQADHFFARLATRAASSHDEAHPLTSRLIERYEAWFVTCSERGWGLATFLR